MIIVINNLKENYTEFYLVSVESLWFDGRHNMSRRYFDLTVCSRVTQQHSIFTASSRLQTPYSFQGLRIEFLFNSLTWMDIQAVSYSFNEYV